ncbi:MAG: prepilin-type N-terminal cleavage/methylation domain-containing protein [Candidatus Omnitrophica bacterium]|nr:prepilin-type N-terminal cleavage/methylation domain-containing protein [Candidatus Omnitrophota bacterium]
MRISRSCVKKGVTLVELIVVLVISGCVILAMAGLFAAELSFRTIISDRLETADNASAAMGYMVRIARYAIPSTIVAGRDANQNFRIAFNVEGGRSELPDFPSSSATYSVIFVQKTVNNVSTLCYNAYVNGTHVITDFIIGTNIDFFQESEWHLADNRLTLQITAQKNRQNFILRTTVYPLGE